ncbi:LysM peptidoglycan-binding domain-containing protein [Cohnella thailandensis]|uniref:LysM peptidoglycan-binding domain-containing protein n=1 Tax=Cohnella thailandensis TaxID=557557 RepID=A0A841SSE6_9BACL|nr:LysM peptidoglycan-binding domain-containing protein [Cohnella thailandensis]MBB6633899.1 LysM peptidoglycan-binding domain-containing protein [Cohnella thailandensis]MBP1972582.1 stage VI sporulation protein D [Cohnella thailandensis]
MSESYNGLRFDIFERVHLPEEVAAIEELEEIELVPHMQALPMDDQIVLRGHLLLTGSYRSQDERSANRQLEHWIPVEISLPVGRVERLEDLAVEIDNFDVDLLSTRSLNVTGVLGLKGLQVSVPQAPVWQEDSFTVVHQAPLEAPKFYEETGHAETVYAENGNAEAGYAETGNAETSYAETRYAESRQEAGSYPSPDYSWFDSYGRKEPGPVNSSYPYEYGAQQVYLPQIEQPEPEPYEPNASEYGQADSYAYRPPNESPEESYGSAALAEQPWGDVTQASQERSEGEQAVPSQPSSQPPSQVSQVSSAKPETPVAPEKAVTPETPVAPEATAASAAPAVSATSGTAAPATQAEPAYSAPAPEEKQELKVALNTKAPESASSYGGVGLLSQLGDKGAKRESETRLAEEAQQTEQETVANAAAGPSTSESSGDEVEWTRLFLAKSGSANTFRKFKLCVVQREDTLDAIATRYNVQARELQLHNRLAEPHVTEGQILYIP